jgi:nucleotide-binding universal stress UspA family protein
MMQSIQSWETGGASVAIHKVLLATDGSDQSLRAAEAVLELVAPVGLPVTLLYVQAPKGGHKTLPVGSFVLGSEDVPAPPPQKAEEILNLARNVLSMDDSLVDTMIVTGDPADEIIRVAEEGEYGLIVLGSRGLSWWKGALLGSVSARVLERSPCPVLIVK